MAERKKDQKGVYLDATTKALAVLLAFYRPVYGRGGRWQWKGQACDVEENRAAGVLRRSSSHPLTPPISGGHHDLSTAYSTKESGAGFDSPQR